MGLSHHCHRIPILNEETRLSKGTTKRCDGEAPGHEEEGEGGGRRRLFDPSDVPFEFVGEIACTCAVAKTSHVESSSSSARHLLSV